MKQGSKYVGWGMIALSVVLCGWIFFGNRAEATTTENGMTFADGELISFDPTQASSSDITIPSTYEDAAGNIIEVTSIAGGVFSNTDITSVSIPDTVTTIGDSAFEGTTDMIIVTIPDSVTNIGNGAFANSNIQAVTLPSDLSSFDSNIFAGCNDLQTIGVSGNGAIVTYDGCVYSANGNRLLYVPAGKTEISYYEGADTIAKGAFADNSNISSTTITNNITTIEEDAFSGSDIAELYIPGTVTNIGTQSNYNPTTIYGNAETAAMYLAQQLEASGCRTKFIVLGNTPSEDPTPGPVNPDNPTTHTHKYEVEITKPATCKDEGIMTYTCVSTTGECDKKTYTEIIAKTAHKYGNWVVDKAATATTAGSKSKTCTVCGNKVIEIIPAGGSSDPTPGPGGNTDPTPGPGGNTDPTPGPGGNTDPTPGPGGNTDPTPTPGDNTSDNDDNDNDNDVAYVESYNPNTGTTTTYMVRGDGTVAVVKDATPYTADGFDTRYFLVIAFFLAGVAVVMFSSSKKMQYVSENVK